MLVDVASVQLGDNPGHYAAVPTHPGYVDLCALSKDYLGTLKSSVNVSFPIGTSLDSVRFILESKDGNRVEDQFGNLICKLRIPPGTAAGLRFDGDHVVVKGELIGFDFDESDALHHAGGECQLKHPIGHYELLELP